MAEKFLKFKFHSFSSLHTLRGEPLCTFDVSSLPQTSGYVLVPPCDTYLNRNYYDAFQYMMAERKAQRAMSKSTPAVMGGSDCFPPQEPLCPSPCPPPRKCPEPACPPPIKRSEPACEPCEPCSPCRPPQDSCLPTSDPSDGESRCTTPAPCGQNPCAQSRRNNFQQRRSSNCNRPCPRPPRPQCPKPACQLEGSDDCDDCPQIPRINYKCKSRKPPTPMVLLEKKGFLAKCCPCCCGKYKCMKATARPPTSGCSPNAKVTQTDKKDFVVAKKQLQQALKEERKRQSQYQKKKQPKPCAQRKDICPGDDDECADPKTLIKREKAREKYCLRRRKMEQKLTKALEKQYRKCPK